MTDQSTQETLTKLSERTITKMDDQQALEHIGQLVDASHDARFLRGANRALYLLDELSKRNLTEKDGVLVEYFRANAWAAKSHCADIRRSWDWEQPERQEEILALSRAVNHPGFMQLGKVRRCQILTNYANMLNTVGRFIDAIAAWDAALAIEPRFAMARGNRGAGVGHYARLVADNRERAILSLHAYDGLMSANADDAFYDLRNPEGPSHYFRTTAESFKKIVRVQAVRKLQKLDESDLGRSKAERDYRQWCLEHRLFLCPLNDLGAVPAAAIDDLRLPALTEHLDARPGSYLPPPIMGFFNQMKQEYASARFNLFEGMSSTRTHYSDRNVSLADTLDYPLFSLASERVRTAYRIAYSLLDKVAFLVNQYWDLGKVPDRISFKNVWMVEGKSRLLDKFKARENWPLRGLFWLSKELFDDQLKQTIAADARELHEIRNALEHTYLQIVEGWAKPFMLTPPSSAGFGIAIGSDELEAKAIRVMQIARSALFYISFAIGVEERTRRRVSPADYVGEMPLCDLDAKRRRRDPI